MADEAVCIETPTRFARYTVADGAGIAIGTLLKVGSDPNTAAATGADNDKFAGIAWEEKTASDGITEITAALDGVWDIKSGGGGVTLGALVNVGGANIVNTAASGDMDAGSIVGRALETGAAAEVIRVRVFNI